MIIFSKELPGSAARNDGKITLTRTLQYQVTTGSDPSNILFDSHIPGDGLAYPTVAGYYVNGVSAPSRISGDPSNSTYNVGINYGEAFSIPLYWGNKPEKGLTEQGARDLEYDCRDVVVPQLKAYQEGDTQFAPSKPLVHPITREEIVSDTVEKHTVISFHYPLKSFKKEWIRRFNGTMNENDITIAGNSYPANTTQIIALGAFRKAVSTTKSGTIFIWDVHVKLEDYGHVISKDLALRGFRMATGGKIYNIRLKNGVFGYFDAAHPEWNITSPQLVSKTTGQPLPANYTGSFDDYYDNFDDVFTADWPPLCFPAEEI